MEGKVAVLGDKDFVMPFSTLGLDTFAVEATVPAVEESADKILDGHYALVLVAENIAPLAETIFTKVDSKPIPAVVIVPFTAEPTGFAIESLGRVLKMATGIDIIK
jgi:vacuolar-type H+-ATPase subunit F/Vma7